MANLTGYTAIDHAAQHGRTLHKYADPTEDAREGLTVEEARDIAREDPELIYLPVDAPVSTCTETRNGKTGAR